MIELGGNCWYVVKNFLRYNFFLFQTNMGKTSIKMENPLIKYTWKYTLYLRQTAESNATQTPNATIIAFLAHRSIIYVLSC